MMLMGLGMLVFWGLLIVMAVVLVRGLFHANQPQAGNSGSNVSSPKQILEQRYARGEINREQYQLMLRDLA
jgi:putative membrane protein